MIPNTIPTHYERKPTLSLPLKLRNNRVGKFRVPTVFAALAFILFGFSFLNRHTSLPYYGLLVVVLCIGTLIWIYVVFNLVCFPPQEVEIEQNQITVRSGFFKSKGKIYPTDTLEYISLYGDDVVPNTISDRAVLTGINYAMSRRGGALSAIMDTWAEWSIFEFLSRTKIAIHVKNNQGTVLIDVPTRELSPLMTDLGLLLKLPVKM